MDTVTENMTYPCEPATEEEFSRAVRTTAYGFHFADSLRLWSYKIPFNRVQWCNIHTMYVLSNENKRCNAVLEGAKLEPGIYINQSGEQLLLIHPEYKHLSSCLELCTSSLKHLLVCNATFDYLVFPELTVLERLTISNNTKSPELRGIERLTSLKILSLSGGSNLIALSGLEMLTSLTQLYLSYCQSLTELPNLENLTFLTELHISECHSLTTLHGLEKLTSLTELYLWGCGGLRELPGLERLEQLTELTLGNCSGLRELPSLERLEQLMKLNLSGCSGLRGLSGLERLERLMELNLDGCSILRELPEGIRRLKFLRSLHLNNMKLRTLPDWLPEIAEGFEIQQSWCIPGIRKANICLYETTVDTIPDMSIFDQPYEVVAEWFKNRRLGKTRPLNELKVVFLGDGEAGKSHTIARLLRNGEKPTAQNFDGQSTPGIVIRNKEYDLGDRKITVHYWDFGGQEIMHSMHRIFLTGRTMYVILLNARDDTQNDRAKYWLHNVRSFAPDAPVLLVLNKIDQNPNASVDEKDLRSRYDKLTQVVKLSARDFTPEQFNDCFTKVLLEEIQNTGFLDAQWPTSWTRVKEKLENMETHYIMGGDYQALCRECRVDDYQKDLLHWFNDLGVSFCCDGEDDYTLEDYVILRPDWITNALYIILFNPLEGAHNGLIPHKSIYTLLKNAHNNPAIRCTLPQARYNVGDIQYVLGIMRKFNLSFTDGHENEFIPMLCQQNSMVDVQYHQKDAELLEFNMDFDYLPNNLLHRLMVERYSELDMTAVWRTGARFNCEELGYSAVVVIDGNILRFFIRHDDPMHRPNTYLTMLKTHVDRIVEHMGMQPPTCQLIYKLAGKREEFDFGLLKEMLDAGVSGIYSRIQRKQIPIEDILNQSAPEDTQKCTNSTASSPNVYNFYGPTVIGDYVEGDKIDGVQNNHVIPPNLTAILDKLITENIQSKKDFVDHLLSQLEISKDKAAQEYFVNDLLTKFEASEDKATREIAEDAKTDPQKKRNLLDFLRKIMSGTSNTVSFLADAPDAIKTLTAITTAVTTVAAQYGPEIAEFLSKFPILPQ